MNRYDGSKSSLVKQAWAMLGRAKTRGSQEARLALGLIDRAVTAANSPSAAADELLLTLANRKKIIAAVEALPEVAPPSIAAKIAEAFVGPREEDISASRPVASRPMSQPAGRLVWTRAGWRSVDLPVPPMREDVAQPSRAAAAPTFPCGICGHPTDHDGDGHPSYVDEDAAEKAERRREAAQAGLARRRQRGLL